MQTFTATLLAPATRTTSGTSAALDVSTYADCLAVLNITDGYGALSVQIEESIDGSTWLPTGASVDLPYGRPLACFRGSYATRLAFSTRAPFIRASYAITGDAPSFTFDLQLAAKA